jgi:hypothetical protein
VVDRAGEPDYKPALPAASRLGSAQVAQLVEHATENRSVGGSIPPLGTISVLIDEPLAWVGLRGRISDGDRSALLPSTHDKARFLMMIDESD